MDIPFLASSQTLPPLIEPKAKRLSHTTPARRETAPRLTAGPQESDAAEKQTCLIRADLPIAGSHLFALDSVKTPTGCAGTENSSGPFGGETPFCGLFSGEPFLPDWRETFSPEDFSMFSWSKICMTFGDEFSSWDFFAKRGGVISFATLNSFAAPHWLQ